MAIPEARTFNKRTKSKDWSGLSLPQISYGYESLITPLQTLTLYNSLLLMMVNGETSFEREIKHNGKTVKLLQLK